MPSAAAPPDVLLVYADRVGGSMRSVGIRMVELARVLREQAGARVTIAAAEHDGADVGCPVVLYEPHAPRALDPHLARADAILAQPAWPLVTRRLARSGARLIFDLYDPEAFGTLEHFRGRGRTRDLMGRLAVDRLTDALRHGHHHVCANERQRDLWLGALMASGLVTPERYDGDASLRSLIDVVPYGVPSAPPAATPGAARAQLGLGPDDELILWNGGMWPWLDAATAIHAVARLRERRPRARLVVMGVSDIGPARQATAEARALAERLGLLGSGVLFNESWVPYEQRASWLLDADCAIATQVEHLETRYASRTRLLDCFWAGLPIVCTHGDELAARVERERLGAAVAPGDVAAVADGLEQVLTRGRAAYADGLAAAAADHAWSRVAQPLLRWLGEPPPARLPRRPFERSLGERARSGAYTLAAGSLAGLRIRPPRLG